MDMNIWAQYKHDTENGIVQRLIQEEIDQQSRDYERVGFRCVAKKRIKTSLLWGIPTLGLLLRYIVLNPWERGAGGAFLILGLALIWLIRICRIGNKNAAGYLVRDAAKSPEKPFSQIVAEDIREQKSGLAGTKIPYIVVIVLLMLGSLTISFVDLTNEIWVDGMIFMPYPNGCILTDCYSEFPSADVVVPAQVENLTVVAIDSGAFMDEQEIRSVSIPDTVTSLGAEAFSGCTKLESIVIPESITEIRGNCFEDCTSLKNVTLHDGITSIHGYAFRNCLSLEQITLPSGITEIRGYCFENCASLRSIEIPEGVTRIGAHAFMGCAKLESVSVPSSVMEIGSSAFRQCLKLLEIRIPKDCAVDERSFKESPTKLFRTEYFTQEQWDAIVQEAELKKADVLYFVYDKEAGTDKVFYPGEAGRVVIADSEDFTENIAESMALQPLYNYAEVVIYLTQMKGQGAETVQYCIFSPKATLIRGENWFVGTTYTIDELIALAESKFAES